ncbi:mannose-1-phosphate guanyltransferase [Olsenella sp. An285]|uniref:sugar phosphate nucleotidyltransferase n=1 Tax=Olsenella sp. An285 TaxID=1965621 RepID=UPI000B366F90|nr:sugar phosphate nucleotidyltransferase [Olsenella sp. An285]OUO45396.1 mannose-1-phosphate guanyltransferase [Olsenella sp. An285]
MIHLVLLSGGSGTRLWPLSNPSRSKQFLKVLRDGGGNHVSMVQRVFSQIRAVDADLDVTIATCADQELSIRNQVEGSYALVLEPERRDTAPAIMLACASLAMEQGADARDTVVVMPIDTYADQTYYDEVVRLDEAVQSGFADLVLLGVEPTTPSSKYGYIVPASPKRRPCRVERFTEKPDEATARKLISQGALWNCGVFAFRLGYLTSVTKGYLKAANYDEFHARYAELPKNSFDYEIVEKASSVGVVPYSGIWKDLGTWGALTEEMAERASGCVVMDDVTCSNVHAVNETCLPMVVAGLSDAVVVATSDGILACGKWASASVKPLVSRVARALPMCGRLPWGEYRVLGVSERSDGGGSLTRELVIEDGEQTTYQSNLCCTKVWTVISGAGETVLDGETSPLFVGSVVKIKPKVKHAVRAVGTDLHIVEVHLGDRLDEGDVERFGDFWN